MNVDLFKKLLVQNERDLESLIVSFLSLVESCVDDESDDVPLVHREKLEINIVSGLKYMTELHYKLLTKKALYTKVSGESYDGEGTRIPIDIKLNMIAHLLGRYEFQKETFRFQSLNYINEMMTFYAEEKSSYSDESGDQSGYVASKNKEMKKREFQYSNPLSTTPWISQDIR